MHIELKRFSVESECLIKVLKEADKLELIDCEWETYYGCQDRKTLICKIGILWFIFIDHGENSNHFNIGVYDEKLETTIVIFDSRGWLYTEEELEYKKEIIDFLDRLFNYKRFNKIREPFLSDFNVYWYKENKVVVSKYPYWNTEWNGTRKDSIKTLNSHNILLKIKKDVCNG